MTTQAKHRKAKARSYTHCSFCGKKKTNPPTSYVSRLEYEHDPYCSSVCCKADHGVKMPSIATTS